jgi:hypothetical protein
MAVLFDNAFATTVSPFGFDSVAGVSPPNNIMEVLDVGTGGVVPWTGVGQRGGATDIRSTYTALIQNGAVIRLVDPLINVRALCPTGYDGAGNIVLAAAVLASLDLSIDDAAAHGYKCSVRLQFGCDGPMGGTDDNGAAIPDWMVQVGTASKQKPVPYIETISTDGPTRNCRVPIFWNDEKIVVTATGGTFTITWNGQTTTALPFNTNPADIRAALEALSNANAGDFYVAGGLSGGFTIDYRQTRHASTSTMTLNTGSLTGGTATLTHAAPNGNMAFHYDAIITAFAAYLEGTTSGGHRRKDYVDFIPCAMPTEIGSEMSMAYGSTAAYFDPVQTINGVRIGNVNPSTGQVMVGSRSNGVNGTNNMNALNKASWFGHIPKAYFDANTGDKPRQDWLGDWYHNPTASLSVNGTTPAHGGAWMDCIAIHMLRLPNCGSAVAYAGILNDGYVRAQDIIRQPNTTKQYGFTRLWAMQTNLRVWPPAGTYPAGHPEQSTAPLNQWSYRNWSAVAADTMQLVLSVASPRTPLTGFQTAGSTGAGGSYGMPTANFQRAARDAYQTYKSQFIETYSGVFTNNTDGPANSTFVNNELNAALAANGNLVAQGGLVEKGLHVLEDGTLTPGPTGKELAAVNGKTDIYYRFVCGPIGTFSGTNTLLFSQVLSGSNTGDFALRLTSAKKLAARWNASAALDWTDTITLLENDLVEVHVHLDQAAPTTASGYEVKVNGTVRRTNMALSAGTGGLPTQVNFVQLGLANQIVSEFNFKHFGADDAQYMGAPRTVPLNLESPRVTITSPLDGVTLTAQQANIIVTGVDPDSIATAHLNVDGGPWQDLVEQGTNPANDTWSLQVALPGVPGTDVDHTITVEMIDAHSSPLAGLDQITVTISLPSQGGQGGDTMPFAKTIYLGVEDYAAIHDRYYGMGHYVEGVAPRQGVFVAASSTDAREALAIKQRAAGANLSVDISPGWAFVQGDDVVNQAMYADYNNSVVNLAYSTVGAPSTNPRIDMVVARINDSEHTQRTPADQMYFEIVPGVPLAGTAGASLANPLGRDALPPSALWLADLELRTDSGTVGVTTARIADRRKLYGPGIYSENGKRYRLGIDAAGNIGIEELA